jgi:hypothetical protein
MNKHLKIMQFFIEAGKTLTTDKELIKMIKGQQGIGKLLVNVNGNQNSVEEFFKIFEEQFDQNNLKELFKPDWMLLCFVCGNLNTKNMKSFFEKVAKYCSVSEIQVCIETTTDKDLRNVTMLAAANPNEKSFAIFWEFFEKNFDIETQKQFLRQRDREGQTVLYHAVISENESNFETVKSLFENLLGEEELKKTITRKNKNFEDILSLSVQSRNFDCLNSLWKSINHLFIANISAQMLVKNEVTMILL